MGPWRVCARANTPDYRLAACVDRDMLHRDLLLTTAPVLVERLDVGALHGGGCSLSAAIVAGLASGRDLREAIGDAKAWTWEAIRVAPAIGRGARPLDHRLRPRAHRPA